MSLSIISSSKGLYHFLIEALRTRKRKYAIAVIFGRIIFFFFSVMKFSFYVLFDCSGLRRIRFFLLFLLCRLRNVRWKNKTWVFLSKNWCSSWTLLLFSWRCLVTKKISTCTFYVYFYETVAQTSHKNINQGIFENVIKNTEKIH
jgi:hypothetical protein